MTEGTTTRETRAGYHFAVRIAGASEDAVEQATRAYLARFHPDGYGTTFGQIMPCDDGGYMRHGSRAITCG